MKKQRIGHKTAPTTKIPGSIAVLADGLTDDFNNILTVILGAGSLIESNSEASTELLKCVSLIRTSAEHASDLSSRLALACSARNQSK